MEILLHLLLNWIKMNISGQFSVKSVFVLLSFCLEKKKKVMLVHLVFYSSDFVVVTCFWLMILIHCSLYYDHNFHHLLFMHFFLSVFTCL